MRKHAYFHTYRGSGWPSQDFLKPYFRKPEQDFGWFPDSGNDSGGLDLIGVDGTDRLPRFEGRIDVKLDMWGDPDLGVLLHYSKRGGGYRDEFFSGATSRSSSNGFARCMTIPCLWAFTFPSKKPGSP